MRKRILKTLLAFSVLTIAVLAAAVTLSERPAIDLSQQVRYTKEDDFAPVVAEINDAMNREAVSQVGDQFARPAEWLTVARRLSLALVGSGLSLEEVRALEVAPAGQRITLWTDYLLSDRRYSDYFAERFSRAFVGTDNGPFLLFRRRKFNAWLSESLSQDVGYDQIVRQMIASDGLWTDTPQVNFISSTMKDDENNRPDPIRLAGRTSRAFLGQRIDCLQCHDDFLDQLNFGTPESPKSGIQQNFHELAAFYAGAGLPDDAPFQGIADDGTPYRYKYLGEEQEVEVSPQVPFGKDLLPQDGDPRERLAAWTTHPENRAFARTAVNRVWALMLSRPLVAPVDSIPLDDSVPAAMDILADDFVEHDYSLKRLIRVIARTEAFQRSSRAEFDVTPEHEKYYAVYPLSQLRPDQVAGSVVQAAKLTAIDSSSSIITRLQKFGETQDFLKLFGDRGEDEFDSDAVTITQRLLLMNGNLISERAKRDLVFNAATRISTLVRDNEQAIELIFLSVLNRKPTIDERVEFLEYMGDTTGDARGRALDDIFWAMINSTEFSWNH